MTTDGTATTPTSEFADSSPVWSPDGRYIAFARRQLDRSSSIYVIAVKSGKQTQLVAGGSPSWSPEGTRIAFHVLPRSDAARGIWTIRLDGGGRKRLTKKNDFEPKWSPDGRSILFEEPWRSHAMFSAKAGSGS